MTKLLITLLITLLISGCNAKPASGPVSTPEPSGDTSLTTDNTSQTIKASKASKKTDDFSKIRSCEYDFDSDGNMDTVTLYSNAQTDHAGKIMWDDFHQWLLEAELSSGEFYTLFDSSVSTGQLYFEVSEIYNDEVLPSVVTFLTTGSSLDIERFIFDGESFVKTNIYSTEDISTGGINRVYSSIPLYK